MKKVWVSPGCITCGVCEFLAPEVFEVSDISHVKKDVDLNAHVSTIKEAAQACPVSVIGFEE